ncbi:AAA family ATPase [Pseudomonas sp. NFACC25]|uniref:AAA family ATPase n=2 Tax=Pseudomonas TaxID=286 RepID=UPI0035323A26
MEPFMYLAELTIKNFRKLRDAKLKFQPGLNVLVGPNNLGKSAVSDHGSDQGCLPRSRF